GRARSCRGPFMHNLPDPSDVAANRAQLQRIRERLRRAAEFETESVLGQHRQLLRQLVGLELAPSLGPVLAFRRHATAPPASRTSISRAAWPTRAPARRAPMPLRCPQART